MRLFYSVAWAKSLSDVETTSPRLEVRHEQPYVAIAATTSIQEEAQTVTALMQDMQAWLTKRRIQTAGPPFVRYRLINMPNRLDIEVGFPLTAPVAVTTEEHLLFDVLPKGQYGVLVYTGPLDGLIEANAQLQRWAKAQGIAWQASETEAGTEWAARTETMLMVSDPADKPNESQVEIAYLVESATGVKAMQ